MALEIIWEDLDIQGGSANSLGFAALRDAVNNILSVTPGEKLFAPWFGCDLESVLFEPIDDTTARRVRNKIIQCLQDNDPRIKVSAKDTTVVATPDDNRYDINLVINVLGLDQPGTFSFSLRQLVE